MKLITELNEKPRYVIEEGANGEKNYFIEGITLQADIKNKNGRIYPLEVLQKEVTRYNEEFVKKGRALGELGHPDSPMINSERVSHKFVELRQEGSNFVSRAKVLDTPFGKIVKEFIREGVQLGISSRGMGSIQRRDDGIMEVQEDFILATAGDIVHDPSAPDAFVNGIMENREWVYENGVIKSKVIENYKEKIRKTKMSALEQVGTELFEDFLSKIAKS